MCFQAINGNRSAAGVFEWAVSIVIEVVTEETQCLIHKELSFVQANHIVSERNSVKLIWCAPLDRTFHCWQLISWFQSLYLLVHKLIILDLIIVSKTIYEVTYLNMYYLPTTTPNNWHCVHPFLNLKPGDSIYPILYAKQAKTKQKHNKNWYKKSFASV